MNDPSGKQEVADAARTLALLNHQVKSVRAELRVLRQDVAQVQREGMGIEAAQLLEANERLVLAALRAQTIAENARRQLGVVSRSAQATMPAPLSASGELARAEYHARFQDLREVNEQLVIDAVSSRELQADSDLAHKRQIKFLAMAAHELRNPLLPLRLAGQMITRAHSDEKLLAKLQTTINNQVTHMARLIGDLLDGSRVSTGKFRLERNLLELSDILDLALETTQPAMDARSQRFTRRGPTGPFGVHGDALRLVQVFVNLLENAAKYTPEGGEISLETALSEQAQVAVTVSDSGIGISPEGLSHVFDLFVQEEHATAVNKSGLGIGLAVVRELVEAHGGTVVARSAGRDQGSQFVVTLPLAAPG